MMVKNVETLKALRERERERERESYNLRNKKGITLIALVITIIILLLLAGISVSMISGQDGILAKAAKSQQITELKTIEEQINLMMADKNLSSNGQENVSEYVNLEQLGIDSKYSEYIGISNGEMYILSTADEDLKNLANQYGIPVGNPSNVKDSSEVVVENTEEGILRNYRIYGNSIQEGEPSPTAPVEIQSMGNKLEDRTYEIPITVKGKNLIDIDSILNTALTKNTDGSYTITKTENRRFSGELKIDLEVNKTYTFSYKLIETNSTYENPFQIILYYKDGDIKYIQMYKTNETTTFVPTKEVDIIQIYQESTMPVGTYTTFKNLQIEEGSTATEYEPYKEVKTSMKLNAPLRKVGDYADYIDLKSQKVVRCIAEKIFNGSEGFVYHLFNGIPEIFIRSIGNKKDVHYKLCILSNYLLGIDRYRLFKMEGNIISQNNGIIRIHSDMITETSKAADFKTWLATKYNEGNPMIAYYLAEEVVKEDVNIPTLKTFKGRTYITVGTDIKPSSIEIEN